MIRDMMKGIQGKKDKVEICKSYNGNMMSKVTMCKSTELQEGLAQTKKICGGKKVVATTVIETKIVKKKRVLAQQGISKDFTLSKYKAERGNYESVFLKASGADAADSTVNYKQVAAKKNVRRRLAEGTSIARWSLAFDKDDKADAAAAVVSSEKFSAAVANESGTTVQKAMAKVAIVDVKVEVKTVKYVLVDAGSGGKGKGSGSGGCQSTCNKHSCDYWGKEEEYSCKSLEQEYGCDCQGCKCDVDHEECSNNVAKKKCGGKSCDEWIAKTEVTCEQLEKDLGCSCTGCACKAVQKCDSGYKLVKGKCVSCPGKCGAPGYKGDGNCDDVNNNCGCDFDGGDCCKGSVKGGSVKTTYCKECKCKDPQYPDEQKCKEECALPHYIGDGNCDDENNNCGCDFDKGDCCQSSVKGGNVKTTYCKECQCKDPKHPKDQKCKEKCAHPDYIGDGNCDDENNNCGCDFDKGDCCGHVVKTYCKECKCKDPNFKPSKCPGKCGAPQYKGDGICDDENNNCGCKFDGGDCCNKSVKGGSVKTTYCKECKCKDPKHPDDHKHACKEKCTAPGYIGDGHCDDENNNCGCEFDKGECCGANVVKT